MSYNINKTDGTFLVTVLDGTINIQTADIGLIGKNVPNYGEVLNENLVKMLENFANSIPPTKPLVGEVWYDTQSKALKVYDGAWNNVGTAVVSGSEPTAPKPGQFWFDTTKQQLFLYDTSFKYVGPEVAQGFTTITRLQSTVVADSALTNRPIIKGFVNDTLVFVISAVQFTTSAIPGLTTVKKGVNLLPTFEIHGNLSGNAATATKLALPISLNGVTFDGSANTTIKAETPGTLTRGSYLTGSNFDGASSTTWAVDASSSNLSNKIVARDAQGNFSARNITANEFIGNVTGNLTGNVTGNVTGTLYGSAETAVRLATPKKINNVDFDGSANITIKAETFNTLTRGNYLTGSNFNGSSATTWAVDASSNNVGSTVVARDASGNFASNNITAQIFTPATGSGNAGLIFPSAGGTGDYGSIKYYAVAGDITRLEIKTMNEADDSIYLSASGATVVSNTTDSVSKETGALQLLGGLGVAKTVYANKFVGPLQGNVTGDLTGDIRAADGTVVLNNGTTGSTATFTGTVTGDLIGNAQTATQFETTRKINGVPFNGTSDITVADDTKVPLNGATMTGHLTLNADPTDRMHAATKQYVDNLVISRPLYLSLDTRGLAETGSGPGSVVSLLNELAPPGNFLAGTLARIASTAQNVTTTSTFTYGRVIGATYITGVNSTTTVNNPTRNNDLVYRVNTSRSSWEYVSG